jgi:tetratricopeptide (TPR) repeat protein
MAHGPAHERIAYLTKKISKDPTDYNLYIDRAGLYKIDGNFDKSYADYMKAKSLSANLPNMDFMLAELFYEFDYLESALASLSSFQKLNRSLAECYMFKAKVFDKLFYADSALFYAEESYQYQTKPSTRFFVTIKEYALFANKADYVKACYWLEEGKKRLPYDLVIQEEYVKLAMKFEDYDKAIDLCNEKIGTLKRKEYWYFLLATAQAKAGKKEEALQNLVKASESIEKLPRNHKSTSYISNLRNEIDKQQEQLKT